MICLVFTAITLFLILFGAHEIEIFLFRALFLVNLSAESLNI